MTKGRKLTKHQPNPGSPKALEKGCKCSPRDNNKGKGFKDGEYTLFWTVPECPMHKGKWEMEPK